MEITTIFLHRIFPLLLVNLKFARNIYRGENHNYLALHVGCFDSFSTNNKWIAEIGAIGYDNLLSVSRVYN